MRGLKCARSIIRSLSQESQDGRDVGAHLGVRSCAVANGRTWVWFGPVAASAPAVQEHGVGGLFSAEFGGGVGMWLRAAGHARRSSLLGPAAQGGDQTSGMGCLHSSSPAVAPMIDAAGPNARRGITPAREIPPKAPGP